MDQLRSFADERLLIGCIYCTRPTETRDHTPSRIFLDEPYPENLPVVAACARCNQGFSLDEEYVACLVECARTGALESVERPKIRRILHDTPALANTLTKARRIAPNGAISFCPEHDRVRNVVLKLARGHAAYELDEQYTAEPTHVLITPLQLLSSEEREHFETPPNPTVWPELGSRAMQRLLVIAGDNPTFPGWIKVQHERYRYLVSAEQTVRVRIIIGEYLACEVSWK